MDSELRCEGCARTVAEAVRLGPSQEPFCKPCRQTLPYCHTCQAPVGTSLFLRGRTVCFRCFGDLVRCPACRREGCHELLPSPHLLELKVCRDCVDVRLAPCSLCARIEVVNNGVCFFCQHAPPESADPFPAMIAEVSQFLEEAFGMGLRREFAFLAVDDFPETPVAPGYIVRGDFVVIYGRPRIRVRRDLSEPVFMSVFAHEYAHAWQAENCPPQSRDLLEGFARWIQRKVLFELYEDLAASILDVDEQEAYGPGLRACLAWEKRLGEKGLIRMVQSWTEFPNPGAAALD